MWVLLIALQLIIAWDGLSTHRHTRLGTGSTRAAHLCVWGCGIRLYRWGVSRGCWLIWLAIFVWRVWLGLLNYEAGEVLALDHIRVIVVTVRPQGQGWELLLCWLRGLLLYFNCTSSLRQNVCECVLVIFCISFRGRGLSDWDHVIGLRRLLRVLDYLNHVSTLRAWRYEIAIWHFFIFREFITLPVCLKSLLHELLLLMSEVVDATIASDHPSRGIVLCLSQYLVIHRTLLIGKLHTKRVE